MPELEQDLAVYVRVTYKDIDWYAPGEINVVNGTRSVRISRCSAAMVPTTSVPIGGEALPELRYAYVSSIHRASDAKLRERFANDAAIKESLNYNFSKYYNASEGAKFKAWMNATLTEQEKQGDKFPKWDFLKEVLLLALDMTHAEYEASSRAISSAADPKTEISKLKDSYYTPAFQAATSAMGSDALQAFRNKLGQWPAMCRYMIDMLGVVLKDKPATVVEQPRGEGDGGPIATLAATVVELQEQVKGLKDAVKLGFAQAQLGVTKPSAAPQQQLPVGAVARPLKVPKDHDCSYHVMHAADVVAANEYAVPQMDAKGAAEAKLIVLEGAHIAHAADEKGFDSTFGSLAEYRARITSKAGTDSWGGIEEFALHSRARPEVEFRTLTLKDGNLAGEVRKYSSKQEGATPKFVVFPLFDSRQSRGHFDVGSIFMRGATTFVFPIEQADAAERLITSSLPKIFEGLYGGEVDCNHADRGTFMEAARAALGLDGGEQFQEVLSKEQKKKKKEAAKKQAAEKAANTLQQQQQQLLAAQAAEAAQQALRQQQLHQQQLAAQAAQQALQQQQQLAARAADVAQQSRAQQAPQWQQQPLQQRQHPVQQVVMPEYQQHPQQVLQQAPTKHVSWAAVTWGAPAQPQQPNVAGWGGAAQPAQPQQPTTVAGWGARATGNRGVPVVFQGESVVPAVVVFGSGGKKQLKTMLKELNPQAAEAVVSTVEIKTGAPRCVLHCKASATALVSMLIPALATRNVRAAVFSPQTMPKTQQAGAGLAGASSKAGMCKYFTGMQQCPFFGRCKFTCYPAAHGC